MADIVEPLPPDGGEVTNPGPDAAVAPEGGGFGLTTASSRPPGSTEVAPLGSSSPVPLPDEGGSGSVSVRQLPSPPRDSVLKCHTPMLHGAGHKRLRHYSEEGDDKDPAG